MASEQGPGPPPQDCGKPTEPSASEKQVAQDTQEVFCSYAFYRHQQEQEAEGAAAPADPEMAAVALEPSSTMGQVGRQLAIIGDDINQRFDAEFQAMLQTLQPTPGNAYEYFTKIACRPAATPAGNPPHPQNGGATPPQQHPAPVPSVLSPVAENRPLPDRGRAGAACVALTLG
ncbi:bcl-2 homologous antagonist/killer isoform X3 [Dasypus novemcinctus]|uniref:bcl-2 homologous antagonist/killer isoform X3 n=1 Tax=Dasypus novemcinctus TaxID=9361 RepID=UPI00265F981C|nr:bcl-2 homologous antagonist/killer isoform X3 [Dasypus novemcinctus]